MREQIIKYLQGMQCEWFPVEWDPFMVEYIESVEGCDHEGMKIKYRFEEHFTIINYSRDIEYQMFYYTTLDRCKTLLLNAVRSVDELKRRASGYKIKRYEVLCNESIIIVAYFDGAGSEIVWRDGEFK